MLIDGIDITHEGFVPFNGELANYIAYVKERVAEPVSRIHVKLCDDGCVDVSFVAHGDPFERIRRITGYLTGDLSSWNNAKQAEEHDRVKHDSRLRK